MMTTKLFRINPNNIDTDYINEAATILTDGGIVGIPTETVYGLAANALDKNAVSKIFKAKGRPQDNPLIVHIADTSWIERFAVNVPKSAFVLAEKFWPGPLTIILKKSDLIPDIVSAGLDSVALRIPAHPVALQIIKACGFPLAAPSANLSGSPSPTSADHVFADLNGKIDAIVDGGNCAVGVESTVLTLCTPIPRILRPGGITFEQLKSILNKVEIDEAVTHKLSNNLQVASPGMKYKHYAPKVKIVLVESSIEKFVHYVKQQESLQKSCAVLCFDGEQQFFNLQTVTYGTEKDENSQAKNLFEALRKLDDLNVSIVYTRCPQKSGVGLAVYNRLIRAASFNEIKIK
jgi:L-threonylcarbamoyladenylate synthase